MWKCPRFVFASILLTECEVLTLDLPRTSSKTEGNLPDQHWIFLRNLPSCPPLRREHPRRTSELCSRTVSLLWCTRRWPGTASLLEHMDKHKGYRVTQNVIWTQLSGSLLSHVACNIKSVMTIYTDCLLLFNDSYKTRPLMCLVFCTRHRIPIVIFLSFNNTRVLIKLWRNVWGIRYKYYWGQELCETKHWNIWDKGAVKSCRTEKKFWNYTHSFPHF